VFEIGNSLREARLRHGADFPEIEQATKIRAKYLRALEAEQFDVLPAQTYVKGFLRSYAEYLGLDGQLYVDEYNSRYVTGEDEPPFRPQRGVATSHVQRRIESNVLVGALVGIGIVTALVIGAWKIGGDSSERNPGAAGASPESPLRVVPPASTAQKIEVVIKASRGPCWLEVRRNASGGRQLFQGTLERGKTVRFVARRLVTTAGAPKNLNVKVNGRPVRVPTNLSPAVLTIGKRGIAAAPLPA
jgi:hypothetical protein